MDNWQELLNQGRAEEALKSYRQNYSDEVTLEFLESLVTMQSSLREKNASQAQKILSKTNLPEWAKNLQIELQPQITALAEAQQSLDRHQPEKVLTLTVQHPLLLAEAETLRGTALIYHSDTHGAKAAFETALNYDPQHYRALTNLGNIALEHGQLEQAISLYEKALKINERFANAHHNLAVAYKKKGEVGKSVKALKQAQRASQQNMREEAKGMFKNSQTVKYLRWIFFGALALIVYLFFRNQQ